MKKQSNQGQGERVSKIFLATAWLLPTFHLILSGILPELSAWIPSGIGIEHSDKVLLALLGLLAFVSTGSEKASPHDWALKTTTFFFAWCLLSSVLGSAPFGSFLFSLSWLGPALFFIAAGRVGGRLQDEKVRIGLLHLPVLVLTLASLFPVFTQPEFQRVAGLFFLPGAYANWLLLLLPLLLFDTCHSKGPAAISAFVASCLSLTCLALTFSRAGWLLAVIELSLILVVFQGATLRTIVGWFSYLGCVVGAAYLVRSYFTLEVWTVLTILLLTVPAVIVTLISGSGKRSLFLVFSILGLSALLLTAVARFDSTTQLDSFAGERMESLRKSDNSANARVQLWKAAALMALANPVVGVGPGEFHIHYPTHQQAFYYYSDSAHSAALEMAAEIGLVGLGLFILSVGLVFKPALKSSLSRLQKVNLLAFLCGCAYAQFEVSYQFGYLWLTLALIARFVVGWPALEQRRCVGGFQPWQRAVAVLAAALSLYLLVSLTTHEIGKRQREPKRAAELLVKSSNALPFWREAVLSAFKSLLDLDPKSPELSQLMPRLLKLGRDSARSHRLAGEYFLHNERLPEARLQFEAAETIDPYNDPSIYLNLYTIGQQTSDEQLIERVSTQVLKIYDLTRIASAHLAHRATLNASLTPLFYQMGQNLNPYLKPEQTETIYRFLYQVSPSAQSAHGLGLSLWNLGRYEEGRPYLQKAHQMNPIYPLPGGSL